MLQQAQRTDSSARRGGSSETAAARFRGCGCRRPAGARSLSTAAADLAAEDRASGSRSWRSASQPAGASITFTKWPAPPSGHVVAIDRGDHDIVRGRTGGGFRDRAPVLQRIDLAAACPVLTLQKAQARVQMSPRIITVACFLAPAFADVRTGRFLAHRCRGRGRASDRGFRCSPC